MILVSTKDLQNTFIHKWNTESSVFFCVWGDLNRHPIINEVSFIYVRFHDDDYIVPFKHNDCSNVDIDLSKSDTPKWGVDKKSVLQSNLGIQNMYDIQTYLFFDTGVKYDFSLDENPHTSSIIKHYYNLGISEHLGYFIPILRVSDGIRGIIDDLNLPMVHSANKWMNEFVIPLLSKMEYNSIRVNTKLFEKKWPYNTKYLLNDRIYTSYNPYNLTSRPTNSHNGINFLALNKKDGTRDIFIPSDGNQFMLIDYNAYHPRLIAELIKWDWKGVSPHDYFSNIWSVSRKEAKSRLFKSLYGGIDNSDNHIGFFKELSRWLYQKSIEWKSNGYIETYIGRKIPINMIDDIFNSQKVFNYYLQAFETERNMVMISRLNSFGLPLPILYTYDSFLFDINPNDTHVIDSIKNVIGSSKFPITVSWGTNYNQL